MQRFISYRVRFTLFVTALALGALASCDGRSLPQQGNDGGPTSDSRGPAPDAVLVSPDSGPQGNCQTDIDCKSGERCACMPDPNCPMCDVCMNQCLPIGLCDPNAKDPLVITVAQKDGEIRVRLRNAGCDPIYRLVGCCGEGEPSIEQAGKDTWEPASCLPPRPEACCAALPTCTPMPGGSEIELRLTDLEGCGTCQGSFRAAFTYYVDPGCGMLDVYPQLSARTNVFNVNQITCAP